MRRTTADADHSRPLDHPFRFPTLTQEGSSGQTFADCVKAIEAGNPKVVILENVELIGSGHGEDQLHDEAPCGDADALLDHGEGAH